MEPDTRLLKRWAFWVAFFLLLPLKLWAQGGEGAVVKQIDIMGSRRIEEGTLRFKLKTKVGASFEIETLREDVKGLYQLGFYDDISVDAEPFEDGLKLTFIFKEKPSIREIKIVGNKKIKKDTIKGRIDLTEGAIASPGALAQSGEKIRLLYEESGYYLAKVEPSTEAVSERQVNVVFKIKEGEKFKVGEVRILGAKGLKEKEIKKRLMTRPPRFFFFGGTLKQEELQRDIDRIKIFYLDNGYLDMKAGEPQMKLEKDRKKILITFRVEEGPQYKVGEVSVTGNTVFSTEEILRGLKIQKRGIFSRETLQADILNLTDRYAERGYLFVDVNPMTDIDRTQHVVAISMEVAEGRQAFVERIEISGNVRTRDKVIRREIPLIEGDVFNSRLLQKSRQNLNNLGFFEEVKLETKRGTAPDKVDVEVTVKERPTGAFTIGAGFSSVDGPLGVISLSQANLFGRGQRVSLSASLSTRTNRYNFSFFEPHAFDSPYSFSTSLFNTKRVFKTFVGFDEESSGGSVGIGRRLFEEVFGRLTYRFETVEISNLPGDAPQELLRQQGESTTSAVGFNFTRELFDNRFDPTQGLRLFGGLELAGSVLGGDNYFTKYTAEASYFHPVLANLGWGLVGHLRGYVTLVEPFGGRSVPLQERVFFGGPDTIRGFRNFSISPVDPVSGTRVGGGKGYVMNAEIIFPIFRPINLKGVFFFDAGNVFAIDEPVELSLKTSVGAGIRVRTPVGPIRLEWGINLRPKEGESSSQFHFTAGTVF